MYVLARDCTRSTSLATPGGEGRGLGPEAAARGINSSELLLEDVEAGAHSEATRGFDSTATAAVLLRPKAEDIGALQEGKLYAVM